MNSLSNYHMQRLSLEEDMPMIHEILLLVVEDDNELKLVT